MDLAGTLKLSFLTAYPFIMLNKPSAMFDKCMTFMVKYSDATIQQNLKMDSRVSTRSSLD